MKALLVIAPVLFAVGAIAQLRVGTVRVGAVRQPIPETLYHIPWGGQSLATGSRSTNPVSTNALHIGYCLMLTNGVHAGEPGTNGIVLLSGDVNEFTNLVASFSDIPPRGETPSVAAAFAVNFARSNAGMARLRLLATGHAQNGAMLTQINRGTIPYSNLMTQVRGAQTVAWGTKRFSQNVPAVCWVHGETDTGQNIDPEFYRTNSYTLYGQMHSDFSGVTGQTNVPLWLMTQTASSSYGNRTNSYIAYAQYGLTSQDSRIKLVCPTYIFETIADGVHLTTDGYKYLGEYFGKVLAMENWGSDWLPLRPTNIQASGSSVTITWHVPVPPLVWDTNRVAHIDNYGFSLLDGTITSTPQIVGSNQVTFNYSGSPIRVRYGWNAVAGLPDGPTTGQRGNLRDSDATEAYSLPGTNLFNWAVIFHANITTNTAPTTPTATLASGNVLLSWDYQSLAHKFRVKRSLTFGGPYTAIADSPTNNWRDTGPTAGVTNYYVVSSLNDSGESANSTQVYAKP